MPARLMGALVDIRFTVFVSAREECTRHGRTELRRVPSAIVQRDFFYLIADRAD